MTNRQDDSGAGLRSLVLQAVARGWCAPKTAHKEMDANLAEAIADAVIASFPALSPQGSEPAGVGEPVAWRWLRNGEPMTPWCDGQPSERQLQAQRDCAEVANWQVEHAYAAPAPAQQAVTDAMVRRALRAPFRDGYVSDCLLSGTDWDHECMEAALTAALNTTAQGASDA